MALYVSDEEEDPERYSTHRRSSWIFRPEDILTASREGALTQLEGVGDDLYEGVLIDDSVILGESDIESEGKAMPPPTSRPPAVDTSFMDDVLATGKMVGALIELIRKSGATLVGCGFLIDKAYEGGRDVLPKDAMIHSLVSIASVKDSVIHFEGALAL